MTDVRQGRAGAAPKKVSPVRTGKQNSTKASSSTSRVTKADPGRRQRSAPETTTSQVAQVRLQAEEMTALRDVMRQLSLPTTSEALREGIRLLVREAREIAAADDIQHFYTGQRAPLPGGVAPATEAELAAADAEEW
jgi:hypothetical protein